MRNYDFDTQTYVTGGRIPVYRNCNGITITNTGDNIVTVENITLYPGTPGSIQGDSVSIGGNEGEILVKKQLTIAFAAPATPGQKVSITQKYYK